MEILLLVCTGPPKIHVPPRFQDVAIFEKGEDFVMKIPFTGSPKPKIRWSKDNVDLSTEGRYRVEIGERHAFLYVSKADKCDDGRYRLTLDNDLGSDTAIFNVKINGFSIFFSLE